MLLLEEEFWAEIGQNIKFFRKKAGLTQADLATAIGRTRCSVVNLESGRQRVPLYTIYCIAWELDVNNLDIIPDALVGDK